jgi:type I restriction enzyme S subunit
MARLETLARTERPITYGVVKPGPEDPSGVTFVRGGDISGGRIAIASLRTITKAVSDQYKRTLLNGGELLVSLVGNPGEVAIAPPSLKGANIARQVGLVSLNDRVNAKYVFYFLSSPLGKRALIAQSLGSVQTVINLRDLKRVELPVPNKSVQHEIVSALAALDDRIDNLRAANATLEAIAQTLFESWFVDFDPVHAKADGRAPAGMDAATAALFPCEFEDSELGPIPKGWRVDGLGAISENIREQAKPGGLDPATPYTGLEHMPRGSIALTDHGVADGLASNKFWYQRNDILFGKLRPYFHKVGAAADRGVCSTDILVIRPVAELWFGYTVVQFSSDDVIAYATRLSNGAKMPRTNWHDLAKYRVALPPQNVATAFDDAVRPLIARIQANVATGATLADLRDTLLPRLISGKLRLTDVEQFEEAAA